MILETLILKLEKRYGEAPGISYFDKNGEYLGVEGDLEEVYHIKDIYKLKVKEAKPGYHEWLVKLNI